MMNDRKRPKSQESTSLEFNPGPEPGSPAKKQKFSESQQSILPLRENQTIECKVKTEPPIGCSAVNQKRSGPIPDYTSLLALASISLGSPFIAPYYAPVPKNPGITPGTRCSKGKRKLLYHEQSSKPIPSSSSRPHVVDFPPFLPTLSQSDGISDVQPFRQADIGIPLASKDNRKKVISPRSANLSPPLFPCQSTTDGGEVSYDKGYKSTIFVAKDKNEDGDYEEGYDGYRSGMDLSSSLFPASERGFKGKILSETGNRSTASGKSNESISDPSKDSRMPTQSPSQFDTRAIKRAFASKDARLKFELTTTISPTDESSESIVSRNKDKDQLGVSVDIHSKLASGESKNLPYGATSQYNPEMAVDDNKTALEHIKNHGRCSYCLDKGKPDLALYGYAVRPEQSQKRIKRKELPWINKSIPKDDLIEGPLTRRILHLQKGGDQFIITTIEFTDAPGEDNLHAFIDRAEEDARKAGMPEHLVPVKLIVTWDNGAQLNAIQRGIKNLDKDSSVHLIRCSKGWRCAIRQMRNKWFWGNQNWTIWWMQEREDDNQDSRGTLYDTGLSKTTHWCMPATWRTTASANVSVDAQSKRGTEYTRESVSAFYKQRLLVDLPTYET
ncbi:hypothetical protein EYC84_005835 [Monilinia fructicola]|uniref:Uncharacterized protein n=1 Tax=Monilinia fructicola TaxID=38448 RepID=A0A5M9K0R3_MONFR|nr:hypothetical protein EYC84_005835 [Monilinia fructicola]